MKLIVGLGNPGKNYEKTFHNLGAQTVKKAASALDFLNPANFSYSKKFDAEILSGFYQQEKVVIAQPQTWMNESGRAIVKLLNFFHLSPTDLWLVYDDIDLPLGKVRIKKQSSAGGHKGVQSVSQIIRTNDFYHFKLGIGPQGRLPAEKYVLQKISKLKQLKINRAQKNMVAAITYGLEHGLGKTMNKFN